jgi:phospholipase/carboxylesterase
VRSRAGSPKRKPTAEVARLRGSRHAPCSRRDALGLTLGALASSLPACRSHAPAPPEESTPPAESASVAEQLAAAPFGGLEVTSGGDLAEDERGGIAVVLLHGYGASGDDLVSLARSLAHPRTRYVVPAGPLALPNGGRAWWPLKARSNYNAEQELLVPLEQLLPARAAVQGVLRTVRERYAPETLCLLGFSQGAMLALDVALLPSPVVDRVAVLSGALPVPTAQELLRPRHARPKVFVSHGRDDRVLRFAGAERLVAQLKSADCAVSFSPFNSGHEISPGTVALLREFLFET